MAISGPPSRRPDGRSVSAAIESADLRGGSRTPWRRRGPIEPRRGTDRPTSRGTRTGARSTISTCDGIASSTRGLAASRRRDADRLPRSAGAPAPDPDAPTGSLPAVPLSGSPDREHHLGVRHRRGSRGHGRTTGGLRSRRTPRPGALVRPVDVARDESRLQGGRQAGGRQGMRTAGAARSPFDRRETRFVPIGLEEGSRPRIRDEADVPGPRHDARPLLAPLASHQSLIPSRGRIPLPHVDATTSSRPPRRGEQATPQRANPLRRAVHPHARGAAPLDPALRVRRAARSRPTIGRFPQWRPR
jgi:hypothetical protein